MGEGCTKCGYRGYKEKRVKPLEYVSNEGFSLFSAYKWLKNYNILPIEGGLQNQSAKFVRTVEYCDIIASKMQSIKEKFKTAQGKKIESMQQMMRGKRGRKTR
jgi:hypothetical protein